MGSIPACTNELAMNMSTPAPSSSSPSSSEGDRMQQSSRGHDDGWPALPAAPFNPTSSHDHMQHSTPLTSSSSLEYPHGCARPAREYHASEACALLSSPSWLAAAVPALQQPNTPDADLSSKQTFFTSYVNTLIPSLRRIHSHSLSLSLDEKLSAVKAAADMSLAVSAGSQNAWSQALLKEVAVSPSSSAASSLSSSSSSSSTSCRSLLLRRLKKRSCVRKPLVGRGRRPSNASSNCKKLTRGRLCGSVNAYCTPVGLPNESIFYSTQSSSNRTASYFPSLASSAAGSSADMVSRGEYLHPAIMRANRQSRSGRPTIVRRRRSNTGLSSYLKILKSSRCKSKLIKQRAQLLPSSSARMNGSSRVGRTPSPAAISEQQIESLGGLVPGGRNMDVPVLLQEAADYIVSLQMQVQALQSLALLVSSS